MIKKKFKRKMMVGLSAIAVAFTLVSSLGIVTYASEGIGEEDTEDDGIVPYSDIIEYRYKVEGTKVYRRLYNYSKECWVGEWEFVTEGYIKP